MSKCPCGRTPDPGMCQAVACGRVTGGHCVCMHDDTVIREGDAVRQWGSD